MNNSGSSPNKILAALLALTVFLAGIAAVLSTTREGKEFDSNRPEGVIQKYLSAVVEGRNEEAVDFLAADTSCDANDLDRNWVPETVRINLVSTQIDGEKAFVKVAVDISSGGPFDDYYTEDHNFRLVRESAGWRILGIPWPLYSCGDINK